MAGLDKSLATHPTTFEMPLTKGYQPLSETGGEVGRGRGIGAAAVIVDAAEEVARSDFAAVSWTTVVSWATDGCGYPVSATWEVAGVGDSVGGDNWFASDATPSTTATTARNGKNSQGLRSLRTRLVGADLATFADRSFEVGFALTSTEYIVVLH